MTYNNIVSGNRISHVILSSEEQIMILSEIAYAANRVHIGNVIQRCIIDMTKITADTGAVIKLVKSACEHLSYRINMSSSIRWWVCGAELYVILLPDYRRRAMRSDDENIKALSVILKKDISAFQPLSEDGVARLLKEMRSVGLSIFEHMEKVARLSGKPLPEVAPEQWSKRKSQTWGKSYRIHSTCLQGLGWSRVN